MVEHSGRLSLGGQAPRFGITESNSDLTALSDLDYSACIQHTKRCDYTFASATPTDCTETDDQNHNCLPKDKYGGPNN